MINSIIKEDQNPMMRKFKLTTEHATASYGIPVLVEKNGQAYGPNDLLPGCTLRALDWVAQHPECGSKEYRERFIVSDIKKEDRPMNDLNEPNENEEPITQEAAEAAVMNLPMGESIVCGDSVFKRTPSGWKILHPRAGYSSYHNAWVQGSRTEMEEFCFRPPGITIIDGEFCWDGDFDRVLDRGY